MKKLLIMIMLLSVFPVYPVQVSAAMTHQDAFKVGDRVAVKKEAIPAGEGSVNINSVQISSTASDMGTPPRKYI